MLLFMLHADLSRRDCKDCWQYMYDEKSGKKAMHRGEHVERKIVLPPCVYGRCKKKSPDAFEAMLPHNIEAYEHYLECRATNSFPDDPIVKRNAKIFLAITTEVEKQEQKLNTIVSNITSSLGRLR